MEKLKPVLAFFVLALAVALAYANSLDVDFVYDDYAFVYDNEAIRTFTPLSKFLLSPEAFSQPSNDHVFRPLASFTFALNHAVHGLQPAGYHVVNLVFHALNAFLVFLLLRRIGFRDVSSFAGALVFAVHPVHTEAVTWISGRSNVLFLFFFLLAYLLYARIDSTSTAPVSPTRRFFLLSGSVAAYALSLLAKEMALPLPALLFGHDLYFHRDWDRKQRLRSVLSYIPFVLVAVAYVLLRTHVLGKVGQVSYHGGSAYVTLLAMLRAAVIYARLLLVPVGLSLSRHFQPSHSIFDMSVFPSFCLIILGVAAAIVTFRRGSYFSFALFWFVVAMLPVSNIIPVNAIVADRFLYGPSIGFCVLIAVCVASGSGKTAVRGLLTTSAVVAVVFCYMLLSVGRNNDWENAILLWSKTAKSSPTSYVAFNNLGFEYMKRGRISEAIEALNKAVKIKDDLPHVRLNLAKCYAKTGEINMAIHHYNAAIAQLDDAAEVRCELAALLERTGRTQRAIEQYETALRENPDMLRVHRRLAALYRTRDVQRAIEHHRKVLTLAPDDSYAHYQLALLYHETGDLAGARDALRRTLALAPDNKPARDLLEQVERDFSSGAQKDSD